MIVDSLGWAYYRLGRWDDAVRELEKAVELKPGDPTINDHLGDAYWRSGRRLEGKFQWQHAKDLNPEPDDLAKINDKLKDGLPDTASPRPPPRTRRPPSPCPTTRRIRTAEGGAAAPRRTGLRGQAEEVGGLRGITLPLPLPGGGKASPTGQELFVRSLRKIDAPFPALCPTLRPRSHRADPWPPKADRGRPTPHGKGRRRKRAGDREREPCRPISRSPAQPPSGRSPRWPRSSASRTRRCTITASTSPSSTTASSAPSRAGPRASWSSSPRSPRPRRARARPPRRWASATP